MNPIRPINLCLVIGSTVILQCSLQNGVKISDPETGKFPNTEPWSHFRGRHGNGISPETGLSLAWPEKGLPVRWRVPIGTAYAGITVAGGRVFTMDSDEKREYVVCLDEENGETLWRYDVGPLFEDGNGNGPRSAPTIHDGLVYGLGAHGDLVALSAGDGGLRWHVNYGQRFGAETPEWGYSTAPLVVGNRIFIEPGGPDGKGIAALDLHTGETLWSALSDPAGYSSPISVDFGGRTLVVFLTSKQVAAVTVHGEVLWQIPWVEEMGIKIAMPVFVPPDKVFVSASYDAGALMVRMAEKDGTVTAEPLWQNRLMRNHFNSSVRVDNYLYGFDNATLKCIDAETGQPLWAQRRMGKGSLIFAENHFIILSERGRLILAKANPEGFRELAGFQVFQGRSWTSPTLAGGKLYLRNPNEIVSYDIGAETVGTASQNGPGHAARGGRP